MTIEEHPIGTELLIRSSSTATMLLSEPASGADRRPNRDLASPGEQISAALDALLAALAEVRRTTSPTAVLEYAPKALAASGVFHRVMLSRVSGSTWFPDVVYEADGQRQPSVVFDGRPGGRIEDLQIPLASPLVEAEVVRRRLPALVLDAEHEARVHRQLLERMQTSEYVVAPITAGSTVIGLLHADRPSDGRPLTVAHRDLLRMFADGVGLSYEQTLLIERIDRQRKYVLDACDAAARSVTSADVTAPKPLRVNTVALPQPEAPESAAPPKICRTSSNPSSERRDSSRLTTLTSREREVLALLASGATNAQLADQLTVAESTVKSHVKHILHKLNAGNRAAAISYYLRETRGENRSRR
ncbi:LuxR C-terminal-related transcriptional regulator [Mycolicibacterium goodii]|uniref:LuxR C-terminal-related transcriptional regulator n=1 Tax=Mycolicibacterium goodii TaxID=134601 RepID=UPI000A5E4178